MAVTRSRSAERAVTHRVGRERATWRLTEFIWTAGAAVFVAIGLYLAYAAKAPVLDRAEAGLAAKNLLNLNDLRAREDLLPALSIVRDVRERQEVARKIY